MDIATLYDLHTALEQHLEIEPLFEAILAALPRFGADFGSILIQEENELLHFRSTIPGQDDLTGPAGRRFARRLMVDRLVGVVIRRGLPTIVDDLTTDPRAYRPEYLINSCRGAAFLPLKLSKAKAKGVLLFGSRRVAAFTQADLTNLNMLAWQIGQVIEQTFLYRNQAEGAAQLALINEVSRAATSILNPNLMQATVTQAIQRSFGFHRVSIYRVDSGANQLRLETFTAADGRTHQPATILFAENALLNRAVTADETVLLNDVRQDPRYRPRSDNEEVKSKLVIPIRLGVKPIGLLDMESYHLDAFSPPLVSALEILTDQLAIAIENARLYDEVNDRVNELLSLNRISQAVSSSLDLQQTLTLITEHVTGLLNVAATSVALRDDETNEVWFAAASGEGSAEVLGMRMPLGEGVAGWVAKHGKPLIVPDVSTEARFYGEIDKQSGFTTKSILCVPLVTKGRLIGALEAMNKRGEDDFDDQDLGRLSALTAPAATAIENAQLYQQLAQQMQQLEDAQAQLIQSAKLSAIGELAAGIAHEINNPLTSIIGLSRILYDDLKADGEVGEDLHIIQEEANRAKKIVRAVLDFARIGSPVQKPNDLNTLLKEALFLALPVNSRTRVKLIEDLAPLPAVSVDGNQIKQVIINIINNAVYAMSQTGGELTVASRVWPPAGRFVGLSIADTGPGIDPVHLDKIFDPFFTTKEVGQGTGLGLSVSYGIIERHQGRIEVDNRPGEGTTFHIILPVTLEPE